MTEDLNQTNSKYHELKKIITEKEKEITNLKEINCALIEKEKNFIEIDPNLYEIITNKKVNTIIYYTSYLKNKNDIIKIEEQIKNKNYKIKKVNKKSKMIIEIKDIKDEIDKNNKIIIK